MRFFASFGAVSVFEPGPELPAEKTSMNGWSPGASKSPSRTMKSWVRSEA